MLHLSAVFTSPVHIPIIKIPYEAFTFQPQRLINGRPLTELHMDLFAMHS